MVTLTRGDLIISRIDFRGSKKFYLENSIFLIIAVYESYYSAVSTETGEVLDFGINWAEIYFKIPKVDYVVQLIHT